VIKLKSFPILSDEKLPAEIQGTASIRYALIPRVLVFVFDNNEYYSKKEHQKEVVGRIV